jgi:hypothetical protein
LFDKRRWLMDEGARFCSTTSSSRGEVVTLRA